MTTGPEQLPDGTDGFRLELTETETERWHREAVFADAERTGPEVFPRLTNMSAGHFYPTLIRPDVPTRPEYVTLPIRLLPGSRDLGEAAMVGQWNMLWETGPYRRRFFDVDELPAALATLAETGDVNVNVVPRTTSRYLEYAPLYHLLPRRTLERFGLPLLHAGQWPFVAALADHDRLLAADFHERLQRAWANAVWPHLNSGSQESAFTRDDPIRLLAHNLDFWLPPVTEVITQTLLDFDIVDSGGPTGPVLLQDGSFLPGATCGGARQGGDVWRGEADAAHALAWTV